MTININNKIKQFFGGNWGKPNKTEQKNTKIPDGYFQKERTNKKRKKKAKKKFAFGDETCPFCEKELPVDEEQLQKIKEQEGKYFRCWGRPPRIQKCECGANVHPDCPCCHRSTWFKDGTYKHQNWITLCTFEGQRKCNL